MLRQQPQPVIKSNHGCPPGKSMLENLTPSEVRVVGTGSKMSSSVIESNDKWTTTASTLGFLCLYILSFGDPVAHGGL